MPVRGVDRSGFLWHTHPLIIHSITESYFLFNYPEMDNNFPLKSNHVECSRSCIRPPAKSKQRLYSNCRDRIRIVVGFITTNVVSSNPSRCTRDSIMWWSLSVTWDRSVVVSGYCMIYLKYYRTPHLRSFKLSYALFQIEGPGGSMS